MERQSFFQELKRRNVFRVGAAYVVTAWLLIQVAETIFPLFGFDETPARIVVILLAAGFVPALVFSWVYELTADGIKKEKDIERSESITRTAGRKLDLAIIGLLAVALLVIGGNWYADRHERWARDVAVPQIEAFAEQGDWEAAYVLAKEVRERAPDYPGLEPLWPRLSWVTTIPSEPAGARVSRRPYDQPDGDWEVLGVTPLEDIRFPYGMSILKLELDGYETILRMMGGDVHTPVLRFTEKRPYNWPGNFQPEVFKLDKIGDIPSDMVRVPGWGVTRFQAAGWEKPLVADDFFIGRHEVTNAEYKRFVDAGGYESPEFWADELLVNGEALEFADATARMVDKSGRPGPATWIGGTFADGTANHPVSGISWYEADAYARYAGAELPTYWHWRRALSDGAFTWMLPASNLNGDNAADVGEFSGLSWTGAYDLAGNAREWCASAVGDERVILGGGWEDAPYVVHESVLDAASLAPFDRLPGHGMRLAKTYDAPSVADVVRAPVVIEHEDLDVEPVSDDVFAAYRSLYDYDDTPLNARKEAEEMRDGFVRQYISFDAPYGDERIGLYLYLPSIDGGPYQPVIFWGGIGLLFVDDIDLSRMPLDFILENGRAVALPVIKGTLHRRNETVVSWSTIAGRDLVIDEVKDVRRTIDYLETRDDIDVGAIGYYGYSWGGRLGAVVLAVENRISVGVLDQAGLQHLWHPETSVTNYLPRVSTPVLQFNGIYDTDFRFETMARPYFERLGTPDEHKKHVTAPATHFVPRPVVVGETLDWYDKYLGPVE